MGLFSKLFGGGVPKIDAPESDLAFVLLQRPDLPKPEEVIDSFKRFSATDEIIKEQESEGDQEDARQKALAFEVGDGRIAFVALMPMAIPGEEAEGGVQFSMSSMGNEWRLKQHNSHLVVAMHGNNSDTPIERISAFTSFLAAVVATSPALGVYWGGASATHCPEFFQTIAEGEGVVPRLMLWSGISVAREDDGRLSLLSLGMEQLGLPDLLLLASKETEEDAIEAFWDLLAYAADRGEAIPPGDTVGRTADQRLPVKYVKNPIKGKERVWRVELV